MGTFGGTPCTLLDGDDIKISKENPVLTFVSISTCVTSASQCRVQLGILLVDRSRGQSRGQGMVNDGQVMRRCQNLRLLSSGPGPWPGHYSHL